MLRITAPHFVAGVVPGKAAAPIVSYMRSWTPERIKEYCKARGWQVEEVQEPQEELRRWVDSLPTGPGLQPDAIKREDLYEDKE